MIVIKSTSRKDRYALRQLISYVQGEQRDLATKMMILHNLSSSPTDIQDIQQEFKENDEQRKKRKGGIVLYHDIISFDPKYRAFLASHPALVEEVAREYLNRRAPHALGIAKFHTDKEHLHIHVVISGNEKGRKKSTRISKRTFKEIKQAVTQLAQERYQELITKQQEKGLDISL